MTAATRGSIHTHAERRRAMRTAIALDVAGWSLVALFFSTESTLAAAYRGQPIAWSASLGYSFAFYSVWMLLTPAVVRLSERVRWEPGRRARFLAVHALASVAVSFLQAWLFVLAFGRLYVAPGASPFAGMLVAHLHSNVLIYWILVGGAVALDVYRRDRERSLSTARLETRLAEASLTMLRLQLQPHFLFNTLNSISALVREDAEKAEQTIAALGALLRATLDGGGRQEVALRDELDTLALYLDIERTRFAQRLQVDVDADPETLDAAVPAMILQPLVENAIRHGVAPRAAGGRVRVSARRENDDLMLAVADDGPGLAACDDGRRGIGLDNTRARLAALYGARQSIALDRAREGGLAVTIRLPCRPPPREGEDAR